MVLAIIALPLRVAWYIIRRPRLLILFGVVVASVVVLRACAGGSATNNTQVVEQERYIEIAPSVADAPYIISTASRVYYVRSYTDSGQVINLDQYYTYDRKKWVSQTIPLLLDKACFGEVRITIREK